MTGRLIDTNSFQSTPLHEGRPSLVAVSLQFSGFQSTPLHEGRLVPSAPSLIAYPFQSTPLHEGRRMTVARRGPEQFCFNPRPCTRGDDLNRGS